MVEKVMVSACLLGEKCRYDGKTSENHEVIKFVQGKELISVCPEVMGGLSTPRTPCERVEDKIIDSDGNDKTNAYVSGAKRTFELAKKNQCKMAVLKSRSPSCGSNKVYDGSFSGKLVSKDEIFAKLLKENGIVVIGEEELSSFLSFPFKKTL